MEKPEKAPVDCNCIGFRLSFDVNTAFDTIDQEIRLRWLSTSLVFLATLLTGARFLTPWPFLFCGLSGLHGSLPHLTCSRFLCWPYSIYYLCSGWLALSWANFNRITVGVFALSGISHCLSLDLTRLRRLFRAWHAPAVRQGWPGMPCWGVFRLPSLPLSGTLVSRWTKN